MAILWLQTPEIYGVVDDIWNINNYGNAVIELYSQRRKSYPCSRETNKSFLEQMTTQLRNNSPASDEMFARG